MTRFMWNRHTTARIRVLLIPTDTFFACSYGCDLHKLAKILDNAQSSFYFKVFGTEPLTSRPAFPPFEVNLVRRAALKNEGIREGAAKSLTERKAAVATYISTIDAAEQCLDFVDLSEGDILVAIGGEVIVPDVINNEFEGDAEFDAYSCTSVTKYDLDGTVEKTAEGVDILDYNENLTPVQNVGFISLRRLPKIFPEINFTDVDERARSIAARYLISNIVGFVGNRVFCVGLSHDDMSGCLNESNWVGGERASYRIEYYCRRCVAGYKRSGVLEKYKDHKVGTLLKSLFALCRVPREIEETVSSNEKVTLWINIGLVAVSLNILDAWLFDLAVTGYDREYSPAWLHSALTFKPHFPAVTFAVGVFVIGASYLLRYVQRRRKIP
jgi:hypothetical protein